MTTKKTRIKHAPEFKAEALKLADKVGVAAAARQLSLYESQIYAWRKAVKKDTKISDRERELATENAKLKRLLTEQDFNATAPNQKWARDITYLATSEGWKYLAVIIDLYSRQVVGRSMSTRMTATLVCDALSMALFRRSMPEGVIIHSDRGKPVLLKRLPRLNRKPTI
jgi:transposase InsO family protein